MKEIVIALAFLCGMAAVLMKPRNCSTFEERMAALDKCMADERAALKYNLECERRSKQTHEECRWKSWEQTGPCYAREGLHLPHCEDHL